MLIGLGSLSAQSFVWKTNHNPVTDSKTVLSSDTVKILAVMVEFQQDNDQNTYGNGKFGSIYSKAYGDTILDPLPHDKKYFENHLEFAKNYFEKVSDSKLKIEYTVLPQVITVSKIMREYSPTPTNTSDLTNTANLAKEVWQLTGTSYSDVDFSQYDLFTIFHAGVGREFSAPGSIGGERDIFSVYLGLNSLKSVFGDSFNGFQINNKLITNTMILPSTESREIESLSSATLIQLTTNGLIVASIASHLGLPDLFNTETGTSAIGRLGLMDGEAIFGYSGVFPPEPSAWEKIYLGWAEPVVINPGNANLNVVAKLAAAADDTTILKIPISSTEYYLVENRQRDVRGDGIKITSKIGDEVITYNIDRDKGRFQWYGVDTLRGVITDIDEFDWAVPGNGIIIWHIDEKIINEKIAENKINVDIKNKGIDVEEADGIQDIGEKFTDIFGETIIGPATEDDFWFSGNDSRLYKNKFSPDTKPNTNTNTGANSLITMENFSQSGNRMGFSVTFGNDKVKPVYTYKFDLGEDKKYLSWFRETGSLHIMIQDGDDLIIHRTDNQTNYKFRNFSEVVPVVNFKNSTNNIYGYANDTLNVIRFVNNNPTILKYKLEFRVTAPLVILDRLILGCNDGYIRIINLETLLNENRIEFGTIEPKLNNPINQVMEGSRISYYSDNEFAFYGGSVTNFTSKIKKGFGLSFNGRNIVLLTEDNQFIFLNLNGLVNEFRINSSTTINSFALTELQSNGDLSIVINNGSNIEAYNSAGIMVDNFPFQNPNKDQFIFSPLTLHEIEGDDESIVSFSQDGNIFVLNSKGEVDNNLVVSTGSQIVCLPNIIWDRVVLSNEVSNGRSIVTLNENHVLNIWEITTESYPVIAGEYATRNNISFVSLSTHGENIPTDFFPTERAYNWPNPVYENETNIRYYVSENSDVTIRIFDLAGDLVANLTDRAAGGYDNETAWNVSSVQSGVYYASIEVKSDSGKTANKVIKIAVIK